MPRFIKPWSKTTHFRGGSRETYRVLRPIKGNRVLHCICSMREMSFSTAHETKLLDAEFNRSKTCFIISFSKWTKLVNRNMKLHNVSHKRSLSQSVSAFSCISFTLMTIDVSCSSKIEKLPSNYSSESAEWKVLHEKKKKNDKPSFTSFGQFHRIPSILHTLLLCFKWGNLPKLYCIAPFFVLALSRLFISSKCFMLRN